VTTTATPSPGLTATSRWGWIHSPRADVAVALSWLPFAIGAVLVPAGQLRWYAMGVLLLSLAHQPVTLGLVYTDGEQLAARRRLFVLAPLVLAGIVFVGLQISFLLVSVIGGLWNTEHTLMQRYGFTRIYRRKGAHQGSGRLDLSLLVGWLAVVLAWAVVDTRTPDRIESLGLGTSNERSLQVLVDVRPYAAALMAVAAVFAAVTTWRWLMAECRHGFGANPATYLYVAATAALFGVGIVHPVAALLGWVGSHAVEYFVIVATSLDRRRHEQGQSVLHRTIGRRGGVVALIGVSSILGSGVVLAAQFGAGLTLYGMVFFVVGGLHIFYDGVIWKLRRPAVAASLSIDS
jgi:hypothetical protein